MRVRLTMKSWLFFLLLLLPLLASYNNSLESGNLHSWMSLLAQGLSLSRFHVNYLSTWRIIICNVCFLLSAREIDRGAGNTAVTRKTDSYSKWSCSWNSKFKLNWPESELFVLFHEILQSKEVVHVTWCCSFRVLVCYGLIVHDVAVLEF